MARDLRNLPDPRPDLPIYARMDFQDTSMIAYQLGDDEFLVLDEDGTDMFEGEDEPASYDDVATLFCESQDML
jgi:hypothetical protein